VIRQLEDARGHLQSRGDLDAVKSLDAIIDRLVDEMPPVEFSSAQFKPPAEDLVTAQEAAKLLGIRSSDMVLRWAREGILAFQVVDGHPRITRESIKKLANTRIVRDQRKIEVDLSKALAPFDATDEDLAEMFNWSPESKSQETSG
jgi:hypothetical protein